MHRNGKTFTPPDLPQKFTCSHCGETTPVFLWQCLVESDADCTELVEMFKHIGYTHVWVSTDGGEPEQLEVHGFRVNPDREFWIRHFMHLGCSRKAATKIALRNGDGK
jgi:hypothetical protein